MKEKLILGAIAAYSSLLAIPVNPIENSAYELKLVDEIICAEDTTHKYTEHGLKNVVVKEILGKKCRTIEPGRAGYFAYEIGRGKGLKAGAAYFLAIEYPEDLPRSFIVNNFADCTRLGLSTGRTFGDSWGARYVGSNPELIDYPLSGKYETATQLMYLHDRTANTEKSILRSAQTTERLPEDGFVVAIAQFGAHGDPFNAGTAVYRIALYEVGNPDALKAKINYPADGLPRRHLFWREEMGDGPVSGDANSRPISNAVDFYRYKVNLIHYLGMNTYCQDMLEFGHNQCWDSSRFEGNDWYYQTSEPQRWENILTMLSEHPDLYILPYYEYAGSRGADKNRAMGSRCVCVNIDGTKKYTHISWTGYPIANVDFADSVFKTDVKKLMNATMGLFTRKKEFKGKLNFLGAWFRPRPEANPISFSDKDLDLYKLETEISVTREQLQNDPELLKAYIDWFLLKRKDWILTARDYLRKNVNKDAVVFYTTDHSEPGRGCGIDGVAADKPDEYNTLFNSAEIRARLAADEDKVADVSEGKFYPMQDAVNQYATTLQSPMWTWGQWRWDLGCPQPDPLNYKDTAGAFMSYTFNRLYTTRNERDMEIFRAKDGLMMVRHYSLNENNLYYKLSDEDNGELLGYFCGQFDRAGKFGPMAEVQSVIYGDPRYIGYLAPVNFGRLFPEYYRAFNQAFLALPAIASYRLAGVSENANIQARTYPTNGLGTYFAVANLGFTDLEDVEISLPGATEVENRVTGEIYKAEDGKIKLDFYAGQLYALYVK